MGSDEIPEEVGAHVRYHVARLETARGQLRLARWRATVDAGVGVGTVDRAELGRQRRALVTVAPAAAVESALEVCRFRAAAAGNGVDGSAFVRSVRAAVRADRLGLTHPGHGTAVTLPVPLLAMIPPRTRRANYRRPDLPESAGTHDPAAYRAAAAARLRSGRAARRAAAEATSARASAVARLVSLGKQTPDRVELARKVRRFRALALAGQRLGTGGATRTAIYRRYADACGGTARRKRAGGVRPAITRAGDHTA